MASIHADAKANISMLRGYQATVLHRSPRLYSFQLWALAMKKIVVSQR